MKKEILTKIKSKRFLFAFLTAAILYLFAVVSAKIFHWLISWPLLEILTWVTSYFSLTFYVVWNWDMWFEKYFNKH